MKVIRMSPKAITAWKNNPPNLVDEDGRIVRKVTNDEDKAIAAVVRTAQVRRKSVSQEMTVASGGTTSKLQVQVELTRTGHNDSEFMLSTYVNGHRYVSGRDIIAAQILAEHGECQLRHPNGTILKVIRDPNTARPTAKDALQTAPPPDRCQCVGWGNPHPGTHYHTCPWNRYAPADEQAPVGPTEEELAHLPPQAYASLARPHPSQGVVTSTPDPRTIIREAEPLDSPDSCRNGCLAWAVPAGRTIAAGQHHPTCVFAERWARKTSKEVQRWLVDIRTGEKVRPASDIETGNADLARGKTGSPIIHVDDVPYAVITDEELSA